MSVVETPMTTDEIRNVVIRLGGQLDQARTRKRELEAEIATRPSGQDERGRRLLDAGGDMNALHGLSLVAELADVSREIADIESALQQASLRIDAARAAEEAQARHDFSVTKLPPLAKKFAATLSACQKAYDEMLKAIHEGQFRQDALPTHTNPSATLLFGRDHIGKSACDQLMNDLSQITGG